MSANDRTTRVLGELQPYIERARAFSGWSFNELDVRHLDPRMPWDYEAIAHEYVRRAAGIVDLGTGGGERLASIVAGSEARVVATEEWAVNAPVARARLASLGVEVVRADSLRLPFVAEAFDLVLDRHEALEPAEVARVLRPGGAIITQQVGHDSWPELGRFFRTVEFPDHYAAYQAGFAGSGLALDDTRRYVERVAYPVLGELVYMIMLTPHSFPDFDPAADIEAVLEMEDALRTDDGIVLTETHYLIRAHKPR